MSFKIKKINKTTERNCHVSKYKTCVFMVICSGAMEKNTTTANMTSYIISDREQAAL